MIGSWVSWSGAQEVKEINFDVYLVELLRIGLVHYWWVCCGSWQVQTPTSQGPRRGSSHEQHLRTRSVLAVNRWARGAVVSKWILTRAKRVLHPFIPPKSSPSSPHQTDLGPDVSPAGEPCDARTPGNGEVALQGCEVVAACNSNAVNLQCRFLCGRKVSSWCTSFVLGLSYIGRKGYWWFLYKLMRKPYFPN